MSPRPDCEFGDCPDPSDYYDPDTDRHLCREHAITEGILTTGRKAWLWNDRRKCWDRA